MSQLLKQTFIDDYLKRLQYSGPVLPNLQTLKTLHRLHQLNIPFENLNNLLQEEYCTTKEDLYKKIIQGHRGGVCFELNTLFAFLLQDLGYSLMIVEGNVYFDSINKWDEFPNHQLSVVSLGEEKWIVDVGYGESFAVPLRLVEGEVQEDGTAEYRIKKDLDNSGQEWFLVESNRSSVVGMHFEDKADKSEASHWRYRFKFHLTPRSKEHFSSSRKSLLEDANSVLNLGLVCTLLRPWGRITVSRYKLIKKYVKYKKITGKEVKMLENQEEVMSVLESEFGVKIQHPETPLKLA